MVHWLDADTFFDVSCLGVVADLVANDFGFAQGVDKGGLTGTRSTDDHKTEGDTLLGRATSRSHAGVDYGRNGCGCVGGGRKLCASGA